MEVKEATVKVFIRARRHSLNNTRGLLHWWCVSLSVGREIVGKKKRLNELANRQIAMAEFMTVGAACKAIVDLLITVFN